MKPFVIFVLWAIVGWDVGAWAEALIGIPAGVSFLVCVAIGAALAFAARQRLTTRATSRASQVAAPISPFEAPSALDRAA
jgi:hypothetical protein